MTSTDSVPEWYHRYCATVDDSQPAPPQDGLDLVHAVLTKTDNLWDNGQIITVGFVQPAGTLIQQNKVKSVVKEWEVYANITFKFVEGPNATIRVAFKGNDGSWSTVGKGALNRSSSLPTMNLGWIGLDEGIEDKDRGVILHEFGHTLGFTHEHQSPRRGETLTLNERAVLEYYMETQGWSEDMVRQQIIDVFNVQKVGSFSQVDLHSIMMYFMPAEMNLQGIEIAPNNDLSDHDKAYAFLNYPISGDSGNSPLNIDKALDMAGIQGEYRKHIKSDFDKKAWSHLRSELARYSVNEKKIADSKIRIRPITHENWKLIGGIFKSD